MCYLTLSVAGMGGGGGDSAPLHNFASIKAVTLRYLACTKLSPLSSTMRTDNVISRGNKVRIAKWRPSWSRHLGFQDFLETLGKRRN